MAHDLVILGGGVAGTSAALAAAAAGLDVVLVEPGRIWPLRAAEWALAEELSLRPLSLAPLDRRAEGFRAVVRRAGEDAAAAADRRTRSLAEATVARVAGLARVVDEGAVVVAGPGGEQVLGGRRILLATGAEPAPPADCDVEDGTLAARGALLDAEEPPASALVVGGGREGVGLAGLLARAGSDVTLVEREERLLPEADEDVSAGVERALSAAGVRLLLGRPASALGRLGDGVAVRIGGTQVQAEVALATAGRRPRRDHVEIDGIRDRLPPVLPPQTYASSVPWLVLAGSVTGRRLHPESARREGEAVVASLAGRGTHVPHDCVPRVIGGAGGCGWSGLTANEARARGHALRIGRAQVPGRGALPPGFVKLVADRSSHRILGVHVVGAQGREAVALGGLVVEHGLSRLDVAAMAFVEGSPADALVRAAQRAEVD